MYKKFDVAVVGGGPCGGYIAGKIASKGYNIAVFEQNKQIGQPQNCAGLITSRVFDIINIPKKSIVQNTIKGANIHSPSGNILTIGGDKVHALAINRTKFDQEIMKKAVEKGTQLLLQNKILSAQRTEDFIELKTSKNENIRCKLLIGADGPYSKIRNIFNLSHPTEYLRGIGAEITGCNLNPDFVEIFVGRNVAPGFFSWIIPINNKGTLARIGLCIGENATYSPSYYFSNMFKKMESSLYLENTKIFRKIGGIIPLGFLKKTYDSNILLVGDAAAQVKPTSGGGIYPGLICANNGSSVAIEALKNNNFSLKLLKKYQKLCLNAIGRELSIGMKFRKIFLNLTDKQLDSYIEKFNNPNISNLISKYGDIDFPSKIIVPLLTKAPSLIKLIPNIIK
jgi:geranylgeranyl reductase family protein